MPKLIIFPKSGHTEILHNFKHLLQFFVGLIGIWQNFEPTLANFLYSSVKFIVQCTGLC